MIGLRRHVIAVVAALFALAVGIALGGGPLSYVPGDDTVATDDSPSPGQGDDPSDPADEQPPDDADGYGEAFATAAATRLYDEELRGHPTAILAMPGADPELVAAMVDEVAAAGGGLTGVFELTEGATDPGETSLVDTLGSQLMTQLGDSRIDPAAPTYERLGQLVGLAMTTPVKDGVRADDTAATIRSSLAAAVLLTAPADARLAPLLLVVLPPEDDAPEDDAPEDDAPEDDATGDPLAATAVHTGLAVGLGANAAGVVVLGDTASGADGLLADLREDPDVTSGVATVDGSDTVLGRVTAMLALIGSLDGSVGAYGASGSDGAVPIS